MKKSKTFAFIVIALLVALFPGAALYAEHVEGEVLVVIKNDGGARAAGDVARAAAESVEAEAVKTYSALSSQSGNVFTLIKSDVKSTEELIAELKADENVIAASPNRINRTFAAPDDPYYKDGKLWGMTKIGAEAAWDVTSGDATVYVAVMDTGIQRDHPDLAANIALELGRNFSSNNGLNPDDKFDDGDADGHGTHVSGTIGAVGNNKTGVVGVNWKVKIIPLKVLRDNGTGTLASEIAAFEYLAELLVRSPDMKLPAVNLSFGGYKDTKPENARGNAEWQMLKAFESLDRTVVVAAAGNEAAEAGAPLLFNVRNSSGGYYGKIGQYTYPASYTGIDNIIVVGAIDRNNNAPDSTNWSSRTVHLVAPGVDIWSTVPGSTYKNLKGTSMATPHVTGAIALLASKNPGWTASQLKARILGTAETSVNPYFNTSTETQFVPDRRVSGYGLLRVDRALNTAIATSTQRATSIQVRFSYDKTFTEKIYIDDDVTAIATVLPHNAMNKGVTWRSSDSAIATVDSTTGKITPKAKGTANIIATASDGSGVTGSTRIEVRSIWDDISSGGSGGCSAAAYGGIILLCAALVVRRAHRAKK